MKINKIITFLSIAVLSIVLPIVTFASPLPEGWKGLLVPAYFDPIDHASDWIKLNTIAQEWMSLIAIANPNSGPGKRKQTSYESAISSLQQSGGKVVWYIHTSYGSRSLNSVKASIAKWNSLYQIDGIFIDEMSSNPTKKKLAYYADLYAYIKAINPQWIIVWNPGTSTDIQFFDSVDIMVTFESSQEDYFSTMGIQNDLIQVPSVSQASLVYGVTDFSMVNSVANTRNSGWLYFTSRSLESDPWAGLEPSF